MSLLVAIVAASLGTTLLLGLRAWNADYAEEQIDAGIPRGAEIAAEAAVLPGEAEITAMARAYPDRILSAAVRDGEWALLMGDTWYYWADGRLLPQELRDQSDEFASIRFYRYQPGPAVARQVDDELERVLLSRTQAQTDGRTDERVRFNTFLDELYGIGSEREADILVQRISFLGRTTRVHPLLVAPLERVEATILARRPYDEETARFVESLASVHGFNWRNIAGTVRRSYHSYGVAVDLVPRSYGGQWPYWLWAAQGGITDWWQLPMSDRWQVPQTIIDAFEAEGFIWGGKWLFFDNLHFEYRPESILIAEGA